MKRGHFLVPLPQVIFFENVTGLNSDFWKSSKSAKNGIIYTGKWQRGFCSIPRSARAHSMRRYGDHVCWTASKSLILFEAKMMISFVSKRSSNFTINTHKTKFCSHNYRALTYNLPREWLYSVKYFVVYIQIYIYYIPRMLSSQLSQNFFT